PAAATTAAFTPPPTLAPASVPDSVAVGGVNGDGRPDLLVANSGSATVGVLLNTTAAGATTASFATQQTFATDRFPSSVAVGDVNGDGRPDPLLANRTSNTGGRLLNPTPVAPGPAT